MPSVRVPGGCGGAGIGDNGPECGRGDNGDEHKGPEHKGGPNAGNPGKVPSGDCGVIAPLAAMLTGLPGVMVPFGGAALTCEWRGRLRVMPGGMAGVIDPLVPGGMDGVIDPLVPGGMADVITPLLTTMKISHLCLNTSGHCS